MHAESTALILIGYQRDYFAQDGILRGFLENQERTDAVLKQTVRLVEALRETPITMITTPIIFTPDYSEVPQAFGILKAIKQVGAFQQGQPGSDTVDELSRFGDRIRVLPGKRGLNAFVGTDLDSTLRRHGITHLVLTGAVTSICIDSTARSAYERGLLVTVLEDCTAGRTDVEQEFFCKNIFLVCKFSNFL